MRNKSKRKGIILAGGVGSRLNPITNAISKQLLPVYDKPMIYYPLTTLMLTGISDILIITTKRDINNFKNLLGDGKSLGINISYEIQNVPRGLTEAFIIGEKFIGENSVALILGDNLFHGSYLVEKLKKADFNSNSNTIFAYLVNDPERYGVVTFNTEGEATKIDEKPNKPRSRYAITGLYFYDNSVIEKSKEVKPSSRGELEISALNQMYLKEKKLKVEVMGRGMAWFDTGTFDSLQQASSYIRTLEKRQGLKIGCPEEVAWRNGWITTDQLNNLSISMGSNAYSNYLRSLINEKINGKIV